MNDILLKQSIGEDLKTLKILDMEIMPAPVYYSRLLRLIAGGLWKFGLVIFVAIMFTMVVHPSRWDIGSPFHMLILKAAFMTFFMAAGMMLLFGMGISQYCLIEYHFKDRLQTGKTLLAKMRQFAWIFLSIFTAISLIFASYSRSGDICFRLAMGFMGSIFLSYFIVSMEMNRIGITVLLDAIQQIFRKEQAG